MANEWSEDELKASVDAYLQMLQHERAKTPYTKTTVYRDLSTRFGRTAKAFEYRMQNISHLMLLMGWEWIPGLKPAPHVGAGVSRRLLQILKSTAQRQSSVFNRASSELRVQALIAQAKDGELSWPFPRDIDPDEFGFTPEDENSLDEDFKKASATVAGRKPLSHAPAGVAKPTVVVTTVQQYSRDSAVVDWVLSRAKGICECCKQPAPFAGKDGTPFLEVHHVRQLADEGSDRLSNAVAVCPNCHRRLHCGIDADDVREKVYRNVSELRRE